MTTPSGRASAAEHRATQARTDAAAVARTATLLRQLGRYDAQSDRARADLTFALAGLVEAVGRGYHALSPEVAHQARRVAQAADRATGSRG